MFSQNAFLDSFGLTDKGKVRSVNQDQYLIGSIHKAMDIERSSLPDSESGQLHGGAVAQLLLVADGVGGAAAGDQASGLAISTFADYVTDSMSCFCHWDIQHRDKVLDQLTSGLRLSHARVRSAAQGLDIQAGASVRGGVECESLFRFRVSRRGRLPDAQFFNARQQSVECERFCQAVVCVDNHFVRFYFVRRHERQHPRGRSRSFKRRGDTLDQSQTKRVDYDQDVPVRASILGHLRRVPCNLDLVAGLYEPGL